MHQTRSETEPAGTAPTPVVDVRDLKPTLTLLVVSLAIAALGVYELCGFGLHTLAQRPHLFSDGLTTGGVIVAAVAAGAAVGNLAWTLSAARRGSEEDAS
ncbi:hypothetical protein ACIPPM_17570 [Streptomyces sp. NPDC090119]|uniref:hypothetical protein n=1 Tax=Streptomyces sp. NPDC090119 TaxID=3365951 RepID=UPI0038241580